MSFDFKFVVVRLGLRLGLGLMSSCRWSSDSRKPIKAEHLVAILGLLLHHASDPMAVVERIVVRVIIVQRVWCSVM